MKYKTLVATLASTILLMGCGGSPESTVEDFWNALDKGEITEATKYMSKSTVAQSGEEKMRAFLTQKTERIRACDGLKKTAISPQGDTGGEVATVKVELQFKGECKPQSIVMRMVKEDNGWKWTGK